MRAGNKRRRNLRWALCLRCVGQDDIFEEFLDADARGHDDQRLHERGDTPSL